MLQLDPGILGGEVPLDAHLSGVASCTPRDYLSGDLRTCPDPAIEALPRQDARLRFRAHPLADGPVHGRVHRLDQARDRHAADRQSPPALTWEADGDEA
jgi:hypothetical protein